MEELLANIEERFPEAYILERLLIKELDETVPLVILVQCLSQLTACTMNIHNKKAENLWQ